MTEDQDPPTAEPRFSHVKLVPPPSVLGLDEKARAEFLTAWDEDQPQ
jgi:hypothetical protein